jgi:transcriptional regulator CtsR
VTEKESINEAKALLEKLIERLEGSLSEYGEKGVTQVLAEELDIDEEVATSLAALIAEHALASALEGKGTPVQTSIMALLTGVMLANEQRKVIDE